MYDPTNHRVQNDPETDGVCKILEMAFRRWRCARFFPAFWQLQKLKIRGRPFKGRLANSFKVKQLSGKKPWLGTKAVLAQVYKLL